MPELDDAGLPMIDIARGDSSISYKIRANLRVIQESSANPDFRRLVDDVLEGRVSLRSATRDPAFGQELSPRIDRFGEQWDEATATDEDLISDARFREMQALQVQVRERMNEINEKMRELRRHS